MITAAQLTKGGFNGKIYGYGAEKSIYLNGQKTVISAADAAYINTLIAAQKGTLCPVTGERLDNGDNTMIAPSWAELAANIEAEGASVWFNGVDGNGVKFAVHALYRKDSGSWVRRFVLAYTGGAMELSEKKAHGWAKKYAPEALATAEDFVVAAPAAPVAKLPVCKSSLMRYAHAIRRERGVSMGEALKAAWAAYKNA